MNTYGTLDETTMQGAADIFRAYGVEVFNADPAGLKKFRNRLMMQHHPDRTGSTIDAQRINAAYDILSGKQRPSSNRGGPARPAEDAEPGTPVWAYAGYLGGRRPNATIFQSNYTDVNFIKKSMWELSLKSQQEYTIWGYDGTSFRNAVSVYGSLRIFAYMATAMTELQTRGCHPCACRAVIVTDKGNRTFWLIYADGKYFDTPIDLEHNSWCDNPSNDQDFKCRLPDILDRLRDKGPNTH